MYIMLKTTLLIRLSQEEKDYFQQCASEEGVSLSRWIRTKLLTKLEVEKPSINDLRDLIKKVETRPEIKRVSVARETYQRDEWIDP